MQKYIEDLKQLSNYSQSRKELAHQLGISQASVSRYLNGKTTPGGSTLILIEILLQQHAQKQQT